MPRRNLPVLTLCLFVAWAVVAPVAGAASGAGAATAPDWPAPPPGTYRPPLAAPVVDPFRAPAQRWAAGNRGLEYGVAGGEPVHAVGAGRVTFAGPVAGRLAVTVLHPDGRRSSLTGLSVVLVGAGDRVAQGDLVGLAAPGLHLGMREGDRYVDPAALFTARPRHARLVPVGVRSGSAGPGAAAGCGSCRRPDGVA